MTEQSKKKKMAVAYLGNRTGCIHVSIFGSEGGGP